MISNNLEFLVLDDNERMADVWHCAIMRAHPELKNLEVSYDGKNLKFDFDGDTMLKYSVLYTVNSLVSQTTEKPQPKDIDFARIFANTNEIMASKYGENWRDKLKDVPHIKLS